MGIEPGGRVVVTGGAGFIGANLVRSLLGRGYRVTVVDNLSTGRREYLMGLAVDFIEGDICGVSLLRRVVQGSDAVIHLAAQTGVSGSLADPRRDCETNVVGTLNVLEACRHVAQQRRPGPTFVFASSNAPLGRQRPPATEDKALLPVSPYGASKLAGEAYSLAYHGSWGLRTVVLRFANVYGPFSAHKRSVITKFIQRIQRHRGMTIHGDGQQSRDFVYVRDLCCAVLLALQSDLAGEVLHIGTGVETTIAALAALLKEVTGRDIGIVHGPERPGDIKRNFSAIDKAEHILGWRPEVGLKAGLRLTWEWFCTQAAGCPAATNGGSRSESSEA